MDSTWPDPPFVTLLTPTFRRPAALARCMASVQAQTDVARIEHLVLPDYTGVGIAGMYARLPMVGTAVTGAYVAILADDDVLAASDVVARVREALGTSKPQAILVPVVKGGGLIPGVWPPVCGQIDLGNLIVRRDVWQRHCGDYGRRYEGDYDFSASLHAAGVLPLVVPDVLFLRGAVSHGAAEAAA